MKSLHKGYVPTKDKQCLTKFKGKNTDELRTYEQVKDLPEFAGVLDDNTVLIDVDEYDQSERLMDIVEALQLNCRVYETSRGKHFLFLNNGMMDTCKTHCKVALGITCDIKLGCKNSYSILKYKGKEREIIYDIEDNEEYDTVPKWLIPVKTEVDFIDLSEGDGRNQTFFNYILTLQSAGFSVQEVKECLHLINDHVVKEPLDSKELDTILRDEAFSKPSFFKGKTFQFDSFARYMMSQHHVIKINNQLHLYQDGVYKDGYGRIEGEMIKHIPDLNRAKRQEVIAYLNIAIAENSKPSSANFIAFKNGIYNVETDEFQPFTPDCIITNRINHDYNPSAYSDIVDHMLDKLSVGDKAVREVLEEVVGYCFYRRNELRKSFILIGDKANGKSTYLDMIKNLLGDENTSALDLKELGDRFKTAELFGKLANIGDDIGDEFISNPAVFKKVVSGDRVNAERKGQDPFDFNNYSKMLFSANNIPRIKDKSGAVMDRLIIVPFDAKFSKTDPDFDPYIKYKLRSEECMEYLIQLGIRGLKRVLANRGFTISAKVEKEIKEYEENNNPVLLFFKDVGIEDILNQTTKTVYAKYSEFCLANNFQPMSNIEFSKQIKKHFGVDVTVKRIKGEVCRIFTKT